MRAVTPWLSSLVLHSLFLTALVVISQAPPELPKQLPLDFSLVLRAVEEVTATADPVPPVAVPQPVQEKPIVKKPIPVKPKPIPKIAEMVEPPPPTAVAQPEVEEVPVVAPEPVSDKAAELEAARAVQYAQTVHHVRGQVLDKLRYPSIARRMGWYGKLVLGFVLCDDGSVEDLKVLESSGHKVLDRAALQAVKANAPFSGGYPRTAVKLPINFRLN
jgi:protein TonB